MNKDQPAPTAQEELPDLRRVLAVLEANTVSFTMGLLPPDRKVAEAMRDAVERRH